MMTMFTRSRSIPRLKTGEEHTRRGEDKEAREEEE